MMPSWAKGVIWLTAALSAGFVAGVAFERQRGPAVSSSPMDPANVMRMLDRSLALDSAQHAAVVGILSRRQAAIDSAWNALQPRMRAAVDSTQLEITRLLRPDQAAKFLEFMRTTHAGRPGMSKAPPMP